MARHTTSDTNGGRLTRKMRNLLAEARAYLSPRKLRQALAQAVRPAWGWAYAFSPSFVGLGWRWWHARGIKTVRRSVPAMRTLETLEPRVLLSSSPILYVNDNWVVTNIAQGGVITVANTGVGDDGSLTGLTLGTNAFASVHDAVGKATTGDTIVVVSGAYTSALNDNATDVNVPNLTIEGWATFVNSHPVSAPGYSGSGNSSLTTTLNTASYKIDANDVTVTGFDVTNAPSTGAIQVASGAGSVISDNAFSGNTDAIVVNGGVVSITGNTFTGDTTGVDVEGGTANISGASMTNEGTGILVDSGSADVSGTTQISGGTTGIEVMTDGTLTVGGTTISDAATGIDVTGGMLTVGTGDSITGGTTGLLVSGSTASISGDSLRNLSFSGQSGNYITLADGALGDPSGLTPPHLDATGVTFDSVLPSDPTLNDLYGVENKIGDYLDSASVGYVTLRSGNVYVTQASDNASNGAIQRGVNAAMENDIVNIQAGTFTGGVQITKAVKLLGANATANPTNGGARGGESIIEPGVSGADPTDSPTFLIEVLASNVTIEGFTLTGQNDALGITNGVELTGTTTYAQAAEGIAAFNPFGINTTSNSSLPGTATPGSVTIENNIIQDLSYQGIDMGWGTNGNPATGGNVISDNLIQNIGAYDDEGDAVRLYNNFYADVTGNQILNVRMGVEAGNFWIAAPESATPIGIENNAIQARRRGIFYNLFYANATAMPVEYNTITATADPFSSDDSLWTGIYVISQNGINAATATFLDNNIDGSGSNYAETAGYTLLNTWATSGVTISGDASADNSITNVTYGIWETTGDPNSFGASATAAMGVTISGVNIAASQIGVYVEEDSSNNNTVSATINGDTSITTNTTSGIGIEISGATASATVSGNDAISGNATGIEVTGGSATISGNNIYDNTTGIDFTSGGGGSVTGNDFTGTTANGTDLNIDSTAGTVTDSGGNQFAGTQFINNQSIQNIDATSDTFNVGTASAQVGGDNLTLSEAYIVEDRVTDAIDQANLGFVRLQNGAVFVAQSSESTADGGSAGSIQRGVNAASSGDTVNVQAGSYDVSAGINLPLPVTLAGAFAGVDANADSRGTGETVLVGSASHAVFTFTNLSLTGAVKIDGFTINGTELAIADGSTGDVNNMSLTLTNNILDLQAAAAGEANLHIDGSAVTFTHNAVTVHGDSGDSVLWSFANTVDIANNTFLGDEGASVMGLHLDTVSGTVDSNIFTDTDTGVFVAGYTSTLGITNNTFEDLTRGTAAIAAGSLAAGVQLYFDYSFTNLVTISGNKFQNSDAGIRTADAGGTFIPSTVSVTGNTFTDDVYDVVHRAAGTLTLDGDNVLNGVTLSDATDTELYTIEDKIVDAIDVSGYGLVQLKAGNIYVTPGSYFAADGTTTASIQRGVDAAAAGDTVNVEAGTYVGQVSITKDLTLIGAGEGLTVIQSPASLATSGDDVFTYSGSTKQSVLTIQPDASQDPVDVTVQGLTVDGANEGNAVVSGNDFVGIGIHNSDATIDNVAVTNVADATIDGIQSGRAIFVGNDSGTDHTVTIENSTITGYQKNGIDVRGDDLTANITGNTITGAGETGVIGQNGIVVGFGAAGTVTGNTISGNLYGGTDPDNYAAGVLLYDAAAGTTVENNASIAGNDVGVEVESDTAKVAYTISGNTITNSAIAGIYLMTNVGETTVTDNTLTDNATGLGVDSGAINLGAITGNIFTGGALYIENQAANNTLDASNNTFDGYTPSADDLAGQFALADKIVDAVDVSGYGLVDIDPTHKNIYVTPNSTVTSNDTGAVQRGVNAAAEGDTVNIEAGAYTDNVTIDKWITLAGAGDGSDAADNTIIQSASAGSPVITITASGHSSDDQLTVEGVRVTGASGGSGDSNAGVLITPGTGNISFVDLDNVASVNNSGAGIVIDGTGSASDITISNATVSGNSAEGIRAGGVSSTLASLTGLTIEGAADNPMTIENNVGDGIVVYGSGDETSDTGISISDVDLSDDGSTAAYNPNPAEINMYHVTGNVTVQDVTITADSYAYGIQFDGTSYAVPAGDISLTNVAVNGTVGKGGIVFQNYKNLDNVSLSGVSITATAPWGSLIVDDEGATLNLANTVIDVPAAAQATGQQAIVLWNAGGVNATGATINGTNLATAPSVSNLYAVEDAVLDGIDVSGLGIVELEANNVFVTPNSFYAPYGTTTASIQRAIDAASLGDTVHIEGGSYSGDVDTTSRGGLHLELGASPAAVSLTGNLTLTAADTIHLEVDAAAHDSLAVTGSVTLGGATLDTSGDTNPLMYPSGQSAELLSAGAGAISGIFADMSNGGEINVNGEAFLIYYTGGDGNDVVVTALGPVSNGGPTPPAPGTGSIAPAAPTTVFVDSDWSGDAAGTDADGASGGAMGNGTAIGYDEFSNIQDAVNALASGTDEVDTVNVYDGTYAENVTVNKVTASLTIQGQNEASTEIDGDQTAFLIESDNVTLESLTIDGNTTGIEIAAGGQATITDNAFAGDQFINNQSAQNIDATTDTFNVGTASAQVGGNSLTLSEAYTVEDRITDAIDQSGLGFVLLEKGAVFVANSSEVGSQGSLQRAIDAAQSGDTINVQAGVYIVNSNFTDATDGVTQELNIDKPVTLLGPNATYNPNTGSTPDASSQAIIEPGTSDPDPFDSSAVSIIGINASDVTIEGFTIDGSNAALDNDSNTVTFNGTPIDASEGISSYSDVGGINVSHNIVQNTAYTGIDFQNGDEAGAPTSDNTISDNLVQNLADNFGYGVGVILYDNFYAQVTGNVLSNVYVGVQTGNFYAANSVSSFTPEISDNTIEARHIGIFYNLAYEDASPFSVDNNAITAVAEPAGSTAGRIWTGIFISSQDSAASASFTGNTIDGTDASFSQASAGYDLWNDPTSGLLSISGGSVTGVQYGVWANSYEGYASNGGAVSATVSDVSITATTAGVYVEDSPNTGDPAISLTLSGDNSITAGSTGTGILVSGPSASVTLIGGSITGNLIGVDVEDGSANISGGANISVGASDTGVKVNGTGASATINGATIDSAALSGTGVLVTGGASATLTGNTIDGLATGVEVTGTDSTATIGETGAGNGNDIYNNTTGIEFTDGGSTGAGSVAGNDFDNTANGPANGTDLLLTNTSGAVTVGDDNTFAGTTASIEDQNATQGIDLSTTAGNTFKGIALVTGTTPSPLSALYAIEDTIIDAIDVSGYGLVRLEAGNIYVAQSSETANPDAIQRGINVANTDETIIPTSGDTVNVQEGTYTGPVNVDKQVTLDGAQAGIPAPGRSGDESIIQSPASGDTELRISASDAVVDGFTIQGNTNAINVGAGIYIVPGVSGTHILNNIVQNNIIGLDLANASTTDQAVIEGNLFQNNTKPGGASGTDIYADQGTSGAGGVHDVLISGNTFTNASFVEDSYAIGMSDTDDAHPFTDITVTGNTVTNSGRGFYFFDSATVTISANTITGATHEAIGLLGNINTDTTISQNTLDGNGDGILVTDALGGTADVTGLSIQNNFIDNNGGQSPLITDNDGIYIDSTVKVASGDIAINDNSISGNSNAGLDNESAVTIDATENWWGSANGPTTPLNTYASSGTGDAVMGSDVTIAPWLSDGIDSDTSMPGFQHALSSATAPSTPSAPLLTTDTDSPASSPDSGIGTNSDDITNVNTPTFSGTADAGDTIALFEDSTLLGQTTSDASGDWTITSSMLSDGTHKLYAVATNSVGVQSDVGPSLTVTIDTAAPAAPTTPLLTTDSDSPASTSDSGIGTTSDDITNVNTPTFTGTAEAGTLIRLYANDGTTNIEVGYAVASGTAGNPGSEDAAWSITTSALADGTYTITATATDTAGNTSSLSSGLSVTIDTVAPAAPTAPALTPASDTGPSNSDGITNINAPTFTGTAEAGTLIRFYANGTEVGYAVAVGMPGNPGSADAAWSITTSTLADGTYTITATATDTAGNTSSVSDAATLVIDTHAPAPTIDGSSANNKSGPEGTLINLTGAANDPDPSSGIATYLWHVTDDNGQVIADGSSQNFSFTPDDNGTYNVTYTVTDNAGNVAMATDAITVTNVAPSDLALTVTTPINENGSTSLSGSFSDPGSADTHTLTINWGDGTVTNPDTQTVGLDAGVLNFSGITHQYLQNNVGNTPYTISVTVTDKDNASTSNTTPIVVDDVAPTIDLSQSATVTNEGSTYTLKLGAVTDPGTEDVITSYSINWGDGTASFIGSGSPADTTETHTYADGPATPTISVTIIDNDGTHSGAGLLNLTVNNVAPTAVFNNFGNINEGSSDTVQFTSAFDPSSADTAAGLHYAYDLNDDGQFNDGAGDGTYAGSAGEPSTLNIPASFFSTPGPHTIVGRIIDKDGGYTDYMTTIDVANVAPSVHLVSPANASTGSVFATSGSWSDAGNDGPYTATVNYGDGSGVQTLTLTAAEQTSHTFNLSHTYATAGAYNITVTVTDSTGYVTPVQYAPMTGAGTMTVNVADTTLRVASVTATGNGFDIAFNRAIDIDDIALYGSGAVVSPISVQLQTIGGGSTTIDGSLIWDAGTNIAHWIQTRGNLVNGTYMVTLASGATGDTFHDDSGNALDGNDDGTPGDNYSSTIVVNNPAVLSIPNFARGPGQAVITNTEGTQAGATGLPVTISDGTGVESVHFVLDYDPNVLDISTMLAGDLKTPGSDWAVTVNPSTAGVLDIVVYSTDGSTLGSGPQTVLTFNNVSVLTTATYGAASLLSFNSVLLNESLTNPIPVIAAETDCKIVDLGDTTDAGSVGGQDAFNISRVVVHLDTGFAVDPLTDPVLIGDLTGDGTLSGLDAADASLMFVDPDSQTQVPTPDGMGTGGVAGHDPEVESGLGSSQTITAGADSTAQASIQIEDDADGLESADLTITYDSSLLTLTDGDVALSNALNSLGWAMTEKVVSPGTLNVAIWSNETGQPITTSGALDLIDLTFQTGSAPGVSTLGIAGHDLNGGALTMTTDPGSITIAAPSVVGGVSVSGSAWTSSFLDYLASSGQGSSLGYAVTSANNTTDLPWVNLDTINIQFSENVTIANDLTALSVYGVNNPTYSAASFSYNSTTHVATWTFAAPFTADKLLLDLNSADVTDTAGNSLAGGDFQLNLNVLPGDVNNDQGTSLLDTSATRSRQGATPGSSFYSVMYDVDGSGGITLLDTSAVRRLQGSELPSGDPQLPPAVMVENDAVPVATPDDSVATASFLNAVSQGPASASDTPVAVAPVVVAVADAPAPVVAPLSSPEISDPATPLAAAPLVEAPTTVPDITPVAAVADVPVPVAVPVAASPETNAPVAVVVAPVAAPVVEAPIAIVPAAIVITDAPAALVVSNPETTAPATALVADVADPSPVIETAPAAFVAVPVAASTAELSPAPIIEQAGLTSAQLMPETADGDAIKGLLAQAVSDASPGFIAPVVIDAAPMSDELAAALAIEPAPIATDSTSLSALATDSNSAPAVLSTSALPVPALHGSLMQTSDAFASWTPKTKPLSVHHPKADLRVQGPDVRNDGIELIP